MEKIIFDDIKNNKDKHVFIIFGNIWKSLDKNIIDKYNK